MATVRKYAIDVSYYQGVIDWDAVKAAGVNYVVLRGGFGVSNVDTQFVNNITGAHEAGIENIGVYWFSYVKDTATAAQEVAFCLSTIEPYSSYINLPVYFDWEEASYSYVQRTYGINLTGADIREFATTWCNAVVAAGYDTGIYSNKSNANGWFKEANGQYLWEVLNCEFWYARYGANNETSLFIIPAFEETALSEHPETKMFQYSDVGQIAGINSQRVDLNVRYEESTEPEPEPEPEHNPLERKPASSIAYLEIRGDDLGLLGIVDIAKSIIWHTVYYGVGDFEIYVQATPSTLNLLQIGRYVTRLNDIEVGVIESINIADNVQDGVMITASGRFAKSILDRRHIYQLSGTSNKATILSGNVETAIRNVVSNNAISCSFDSNRNMAILALGDTTGITATIVDENGNATQKQVSYDNLLSYTDGVLEEYECGSLCIINNSTEKLNYIIFAGADRSATNTSGNAPILFSKEFDNLTSSEYSYDTTNAKNTALIGGEGEGVDRFYSLLRLDTSVGLSRRETWVDGGSINKSYKDDDDVEQTYTNAEYTALLNAQGKQVLAEHKAVEDFNGAIDVTNGNYVYNRDFSIGDIVTVQDNEINKYIDVRITEVTEVQDENGYTIEANYQS